jgi:hypothetical protein
LSREGGQTPDGVFSHAPHGAFVPSGTYLPITFTAELPDIIIERNQLLGPPLVPPINIEALLTASEKPFLLGKVEERDSG